MRLRAGTPLRQPGLALRGGGAVLDSPRTGPADQDTDRRDALKLARLARSGNLAVVRVPDIGHEAVRDVVRAREDAVHEQRNARHRLKALLLRNGIAYAGRSAWTARNRRAIRLRGAVRSPRPVAFPRH